MKLVISETEFEKNLESHLSFVDNEFNTLVVRRESKTDLVVLSETEYNTILETLHLFSSKKNARWILDSIKQMESGKTVTPNLRL